MSPPQQKMIENLDPANHIKEPNEQKKLAEEK